MGCTCGKNQKVVNHPQQVNKNNQKQSNDNNHNNDTNKPDVEVDSISSLQQIQQRQARHHILQSQSLPNQDKFQYQQKSKQQNGSNAQQQQYQGMVEQKDLIDDADEQLFQQKENHISQIKMQSVPAQFGQKYDIKIIKQENKNQSQKKNIDLNENHKPFEATTSNIQEKAPNLKINHNQIAPDLTKPLDTEQLEETQQISCVTPKTIQKQGTNKIVPVQKTLQNENIFASSQNNDSIIQNDQVSYAVLSKKNSSLQGVNNIKAVSLESNYTHKKLQQNSLMNNDELMIQEAPLENNQMDEDFSECEEKSQYSNFQVPKVEKIVNNIEKFQRGDSADGSPQKNNDQNQLENEDSFDVFPVTNNQLNKTASDKGNQSNQDINKNENILEGLQQEQEQKKINNKNNNNLIQQNSLQIQDQMDEGEHNVHEIMFIRETRDGRIESKVKFDDLNLSDYQGDNYNDRQEQLKRESQKEIEENKKQSNNINIQDNKQENILENLQEKAIENQNEKIQNVSVLNNDNNQNGQQNQKQQTQEQNNSQQKLHQSHQNSLQKLEQKQISNQQISEYDDTVKLQNQISNESNNQNQQNNNNNLQNETQQKQDIKEQQKQQDQIQQSEIQDKNNDLQEENIENQQKINIEDNDQVVKENKLDQDNIKKEDVLQVDSQQQQNLETTQINNTNEDNVN